MKTTYSIRFREGLC